ncbi:MAG: hypothetical protein AVDCRST_MAG08-35, partial [uncultured Acetobacteraceae bacterium]
GAHPILRRPVRRPGIPVRRDGHAAGGGARLRPPLGPAALPHGRGAGAGKPLRRADRQRHPHARGRLRAHAPHRLRGRGVHGWHRPGGEMAGAGAAGRRDRRVRPCGGADAEPEPPRPRRRQGPLHRHSDRGRGGGDRDRGDAHPQAV